MRKCAAFFVSLGMMLLSNVVPVFAAGTSEHAAVSVPIWMCIPFAGLLLCIAVLQLVAGEW